MKSHREGPSSRTWSPLANAPPPGAPAEQRGGCPLRCPRSRKRHKEAGQQQPLTPPPVGNCPVRDSNWLPGLNLVLIRWVTLDKSLNFSGPKFLFGKILRKMLGFFLFLFTLPLLRGGEMMGVTVNCVTGFRCYKCYRIDRSIQSPMMWL